MDQFLFISELQHFLLTLGISLLFFWRWRDWRVVPFCFFFGFLIDLDHLFDYFAYYGFNFKLVRFLDVHSYMDPAGKVYVFLHGWEYLLPFWLLGHWLGKRWKIKKLEWAIFLAYLGHLLIDQLSFPHHPWMYSFIYRLVNGFSLESVVGGFPPLRERAVYPGRSRRAHSGVSLSLSKKVSDENLNFKLAGY